MSVTVAPRHARCQAIDVPITLPPTIPISVGWLSHARYPTVGVALCYQRMVAARAAVGNRLAGSSWFGQLEVGVRLTSTADAPAVTTSSGRLATISTRIRGGTLAAFTPLSDTKMCMR